MQIKRYRSIGQAETEVWLEILLPINLKDLSRDVRYEEFSVSVYRKNYTDIMPAF